MRRVFDLDECLVATRAAHTAAFAAVGVTMPTNDDRFKPARCWLADHEKYLEKKRIFPDYLYLVHPLPALQMLRKNSIILTGTSEESFELILQKIPVLKCHKVHCGMDSQQKLDWMNANEIGIYFDDWSHFIDRVRRETKWLAVDVSGF